MKRTREREPGKTRTHRSSIVWAIGAVAAIAGGGLTGCDRSCDATLTCHVDGTSAGPACPDDPADGVVSGECGIWVSASFGDDSNEGTPSHPVKTILRAVQLASAPPGPPRIYACGETYVEAVALPSGLSLFGGFSECNRGTWSHAKDGPRAVIAPMQPGVIALRILKGEARSFVGDIVARAVDATAPGGSSIAVFAADDSIATFVRADFVAGNGHDGADGAPGHDSNKPAQHGLSGNPGADACSLSLGLGGAQVTLQCADGTTSIGGYGGDGGDMVANPGDHGYMEPAPNPQGFGAGGQPETAFQACTPGFGGAQGADGLNGFGAMGQGRLTEDGQFVGAKGGDGTPGAPGQGGGGGGGSFGNALCGGAPHGGAGGGSGGTGGCGGRGGRGGQAGGSSIGIAIRSKGRNIILGDDVAAYVGNGGKGGAGGALQPGGQPGLPGLGGMSWVNGIAGGCIGGGGGKGGNGGNGGGGGGGHAVAIATAGEGVLGGPIISHHGTAGDGGFGGNPALPQTNGAQGHAGTSVDLDP
jgi:hypothetical protein